MISKNRVRKIEEKLSSDSEPLFIIIRSLGDKGELDFTKSEEVFEENRKILTTSIDPQRFDVRCFHWGPKLRGAILDHWSEIAIEIKDFIFRQVKEHPIEEEVFSKAIEKKANE